MTIKSSFDETQTWNDGKLVYRGRSAYSDQLAKDKRGNGMDEVIEGSPAFVQGDPRYGGGTAIRFDGVDDIVRIDVETDGIFDFEAENSFTLEVVFRTTDYTSGGASGSGPLISKDVGASTPSYWLRIQDGKTRFLVDDGSGSASVTSNTDVTDGLWHHLAAVRDAGNHELRLYLDYVLVGTVADPTDGDFGNTNDLLLGAFNASTPGSKRFIGDIDLARVSFGALGTDQFVQPDLLAGDLDGDGFAGIADLNSVLGAWNQNVAIGQWDAGDPSGDGFVGIEDLNTVLGNWNAGTPPAAGAVPEPQSALILAALGLTLGVKQQRGARVSS